MVYTLFVVAVSLAALAVVVAAAVFTVAVVVVVVAAALNIDVNAAVVIVFNILIMLFHLLMLRKPLPCTVACRLLKLSSLNVSARTIIRLILNCIFKISIFINL
jgi:hypothetical protein